MAGQTPATVKRKIAAWWEAGAAGGPPGRGSRDWDASNGNTEFQSELETNEPKTKQNKKQNN